ncbi:OmpA family protein [Erythrobacter sp. JK5]|uniref:OmpA family protein n=1 Tax=Erythrobacter sp. JK5 TaxID=2829500 RepID=UPI002012FFB6|nr:OmpA family protein [Erythrobacter sp. JK5]
MSADTDTLRGEIQTRYNEALAATNDQSMVAANDARYLWASEAKVQCGIALGFLKSKTRDETSIGKCDYAYNRMRMRTVAPRAPAPPVALPPRRQVCDGVEPGLVFFEFDSSVPGSDAAQTVRAVATNARECGWNRFRVVGHTDRSGSDAYNDALSMRRAEAVANLMASLGIPREQMATSAQGESNPRVPTADGVRSPENRRVEITVSQ